MSEPQHVLALNCGSSSLKFSLYGMSGVEALLVVEGNAEEIGRENATFSIKGGAKERRPMRDHSEALHVVLDSLEIAQTPKPQAVGHRFVHGGPNVRTHRRLTPETERALGAAAAFAPLHVPAALAVLKAMQKRSPGMPQVVCLDTAVHNTLPDVARTFPLPAEVRSMGVQRYGFHGLSIESILVQLKAVPARLIVAHLGNGSSITAIRDGVSFDTSMGFTPNAGVMMGTRCGDLDSGIAVFLLSQGTFHPDDLDALFDRRSGLLGVSGLSSDVRELVAARTKNRDADLALRMFSYQVRKTISAMAAAMGGVDVVVFTGGIGEHAADVREEICQGLGLLGSIEFRVMQTEEDLQIARITAELAFTGAGE